MYKFIGYAIKDNNNNIVKVGKIKKDMIELCKHSNIPLENLIQIFEFESTFTYNQSPETKDFYDFT